MVIRSTITVLVALLAVGPSLAEETLFMRLESGLTALGYDAAPIDGLPDEGLSAAIARYKADRGLDPATPLSLQEFERLEEEVVASRTGSSDAPGRTPGSSDAAATPTAPPPGSAMGPGPTPAAPAPGFAAGGATDVCLMSPFDFMDALEGTWQVSHGPGFALVGGFGRQNFPAPAPITLTFTAWRNVGVGILSGDGQDLFMLPMGAHETAAHLSTLVQNAVTHDLMPTDAPCGWEDLPAMIGTNTYRLLGDGGEQLTLNDLSTWSNVQSDSGLLVIGVCPDQGVIDDVIESAPDNWLNYDRDRIRFSIGDRHGVQIKPDPNACRPPITSADGNMEMTLILKFSSSRAATGIVFFKGRMLGMGLAAGGGNLPIRFYAQTPVTMSR